jgi:hypothetical protein
MQSRQCIALQIPPWPSVFLSIIMDFHLVQTYERQQASFPFSLTLNLFVSCLFPLPFTLSPCPFRHNPFTLSNCWFSALLLAAWNLFSLDLIFFEWFFILFTCYFLSINITLLLAICFYYPSTLRCSWLFAIFSCHFWLFSGIFRSSLFLISIWLCTAVTVEVIRHSEQFCNTVPTSKFRHMFSWPQRVVLVTFTLIEGNAKCRHPKKRIVKGLWRQVFIRLKPRTPYPPSHTHCIRVYSTCILIHTGRGGRVGELNQREGERGNNSQSWVKPTGLTVFPVYKLW